MFLLHHAVYIESFLFIPKLIYLLFLARLQNLKGHYFQPSLSVSLSVCLPVCLWPALLPFNVDRFWWNLVTRTPSGWALAHILVTSWFLGSTWIHIPNGISIGSVDFEQLTAGSPYKFTMGHPFSPSKLHVCMGDLGPHVTHGSLGPSELQTASQRFSRFCRAHDRDR